MKIMSFSGSHAYNGNTVIYCFCIGGSTSVNPLLNAMNELKQLQKGIYTSWKLSGIIGPVNA
jgi:hypothetical protein